MLEIAESIVKKSDNRLHFIDRQYTNNYKKIKIKKLIKLLALLVHYSLMSVI